MPLSFLKIEYLENYPLIDLNTTDQIMENRRKSITELARELRKNPTESEKILWEVLRKRKLNGFRFIRQKPFVYEINQKKKHFFIADFYCPEKKLEIECGGSSHDYQLYYDQQRDIIIKSLGIETLRIRNEQLCDLDSVKAIILKSLKKQ